MPRFPRLRVGTFIEAASSLATSQDTTKFPRLRVGTFFGVGMGGSPNDPAGGKFPPPRVGTFIEVALMLCRFVRRLIISPPSDGEIH